MHGERHEQLELCLRARTLRRASRDRTARDRQWRAWRDHGRSRSLHRRHPRQLPEEAHPQLSPDLGEAVRRDGRKAAAEALPGAGQWLGLVGHNQSHNRRCICQHAPQAKYKAYERCEYHDIERMFGFKVRRAGPSRAVRHALSENEKRRPIPAALVAAVNQGLKPSS